MQLKITATSVIGLMLIAMSAANIDVLAVGGIPEPLDCTPEKNIRSRYCYAKIEACNDLGIPLKFVPKNPAEKKGDCVCAEDQCTFLKRNDCEEDPACVLADDDGNYESEEDEERGAEEAGEEDSVNGSNRKRCYNIPENSTINNYNLQCPFTPTPTTSPSASPSEAPSASPTPSPIPTFPPGGVVIENCTTTQVTNREDCEELIEFCRDEFSILLKYVQDKKGKKYCVCQGDYCSYLRTDWRKCWTNRKKCGYKAKYGGCYPKYLQLEDGHCPVWTARPTRSPTRFPTRRPYGHGNSDRDDKYYDSNPYDDRKKG